MGKTIALKLNEKEDQIITQLNQQGLSNSELLRKALRHYFETLHESSCQNSKSLQDNPNEEIIKTILTSFQDLKQEVTEIKQQTDIIREELCYKMEYIQKQFSYLSIIFSTNNLTNSYSQKPTYRDVHQEIDQFLTMQSKQKIR